MNSTQKSKSIVFALGLINLLAMMFTSELQAEVLRWPQVCLSGELQIVNSNSSEISIWLQKFSNNKLEEIEYTIKSRSTRTIPLAVQSSDEFYSVLHFNPSRTVQVQYDCLNQKFSAHHFEGGILTYRKSNLEENKLWIQNLYSDANHLEIEYLGQQFEVVHRTTVVLKSLQNLTVKTPDDLDPNTWVFVRVQAAQRFASFNLTLNGADGPIFIDTQKTEVNQNAAYFVVGPRDNNGDQFVIQITDPKMIAQARQQIANPNLEKIIFAKIQKGSSGFNRNWNKLEKSFWSWSTSEVTNIADIGSTECNGIPQAVEDRVDSWVNNPGRICFWSYRIKKELTPDEVASGQTIQF